MNTKTLLIIGPANPSPFMLEQATNAVSNCSHLVTKNWHIVTDDGYGISFAVVAACERFGLSYTCVGVTTRPRNSISMRNYERVVTVSKDRRGKRIERDRYLVHQATKVICLGRQDILIQSVMLNKSLNYIPEPECKTIEGVMYPDIGSYCAAYGCVALRSIIEHRTQCTGKIGTTAAD